MRVRNFGPEIVAADPALQLTLMITRRPFNGIFASSLASEI
jgi:hypothetical protein